MALGGRPRETFTVAGRGEFPFDMLRYDQCWPATGSDVTNMLTEGQFRMVRLYTIQLEPTEARWNSFNWRIEQ